MYIAKVDIGGYKKGDEVPDEKAIIWKDMYKESPVEKVDKSSKKKVKKEPIAEEPMAKESSDAESSDSSDAMHDDYLNRNAKVVIKNLKKDSLDGKILEGLLEMEKENKNRRKVIDEIEDQMKEEKEID